MAKSEQQRQRKLAKKHAKDREKRKAITRKHQELASLAGKMSASARGRLVYCGISESIREAGMGYVVICREGPEGAQAFVAILVDVYCLGVKDVAASLARPTFVRDKIKEMEERGMATAPPEIARGLVESAIEYARSFGFEPHADYRKIAPLWGDIVAASVEGEYEFGLNGKPFYTNGPFDDRATQQLILRKLEQNAGDGNFEFMLGSGPMGDSELLESDADDDEYGEEPEERPWDGPSGGSLPGKVIRRFD